MRLKAILMVVFGVGVAGGSVFLANGILSSDAAAPASSGPAMVDVVVARGPIGFGQALEPRLLITQSWPANSVPKGSFSSISDVVPEDESDRRRAKAYVFEGEVLLETKVSAPGDKVTIVHKLGQNTRAMAIKVDAVTAVGGFVTPGDFVDIVLTQGARDEMRAVTILQNIRVIGVDQTSEEQNEAPEVARTVTVEVTPEQGQRLALAQQAGLLNLTLRTPEDSQDEPLEIIDLRDLLQEEVAVEEQRRAQTITVRRAGAVEIVEIN